MSLKFKSSLLKFLQHTVEHSTTLSVSTRNEIPRNQSSKEGGGLSLKDKFTLNYKPVCNRVKTNSRLQRTNMSANFGLVNFHGYNERNLLVPESSL